MTHNRKLVTRSPVAQARTIPLPTKLLLAVRAGGRCEFDGCNRFLFEHHVTLKEGNFSENAHIVAFRAGGPRGGQQRATRNIHAIENLMLLCAPCHKLIDTNPRNFSVDTLRRYKIRHEERIFHVTGLGPNQRTALLVLQGNIGSQKVSIPFDRMLEAVAPRYPLSRNGTIIDLTHLGVDPLHFISAAQQAITLKLRTLYQTGGDVDESKHVSVFALAPMPILVFLGTQLTNKVTVDLYQRHRDTESWAWRETAESVNYHFQEVQAGTAPGNVAMILSLSGVIERERLPNEIGKTFSVYELTLRGRTPSPTFLQQRTDLERFRFAYQDALSKICADHPGLHEIHLFPAVPAPIAVLCGRELLPKIHPRLIVYDYDKASEGFSQQVIVN